MPFDSLRFNQNEHVEIDLFHPTLGQLIQPATAYHRTLVPQQDDLLLRALLLFDGGKHLASYLESRRSQAQADLSPFEAAVTWLLSLMGVRSIPLLIYRKGETLREGSVDAGSADILVHDGELGLVVIDCTRSVPDNPKIDRLRNSALYLSEQLGWPVRAAIVTPTDLVALQQDAARYAVAFIGGQQIEHLGDLVELGNLTLARSEFLSWLRSVPEIGRV